MAEITELEKQLKLLKEQTFGNEDLPYKKQKKPVEHVMNAEQLPAPMMMKKNAVPSKKKNTGRKKILVRPKEESTEWSSSDPEQVNIFVLCYFAELCHQLNSFNSQSRNIRVAIIMTFRGCSTSKKGLGMDM